MPASKLRIGVVGGSIAGCTAAIALSRAGHEVTVYERSAGELTGRGAGVGAPPSVIASLAEKDMIDADMPCIRATCITHVGRTSGSEPLGRAPYAIPISMQLLNWGDLYRNLRRRVPNVLYRSGSRVIRAAELDSAQVALELADGAVERFDLVLFADGYDSMGRSLVSPKGALRYRGYVLWRGVLQEEGLGDSAPFEGALNRVGYPGGHAVLYLVPGAGGSLLRGERWLNWAMYVQLPEPELSAFLVDKEGSARTGSLPPGAMRSEEEGRLKELACAVFPPYYGQIVRASRNTFAQPIYTAEVSAYRRGRCCLMGDAGALAQPFTAAGVFKGMNNALGLAESIAAHESLEEALISWNAAETTKGRRMTALGEQLEKALIWEIPDFAAMDEAGVRAWWENAAKMPEDLFGPDEGR